MSDDVNSQMMFARDLPVYIKWLEEGKHDPDRVAKDIALGGGFVVYHLWSYLGKEEDKKVRIGVMKALGVMKEEGLFPTMHLKQALHILTEQLNDEDLDVKEAAARAIGKISEGVVKDIAEKKAPKDVLSEGTVKPPGKLKRFVSKLRKRGRVKGRGESDNMPSPLKRKH